MRATNKIGAAQDAASLLDWMKSSTPKLISMTPERWLPSQTAPEFTRATWKRKLLHDEVADDLHGRRSR
jgi:hypothetical protein